MSPGVPISSKGIATLRKAMFSNGPTKLPFELLVALDSSSMTAAEVKARFNNLIRLTPEELDHAVSWFCLL